MGRHVEIADRCRFWYGEHHRRPPGRLGRARSACLFPWILVVMLCPARGFPAGEDKPLPSEGPFLKTVFDKILAWEKNPPQPDFREHRVTLDYDGEKVDERLDEIYRVTWYRQKPVYVLETKNGKPLPADYLRTQEERKKAVIDDEIAHPSDKEKIQAIYLTPLLERYRYRIAGREWLGGRPAIKIRFDPIPGKFPERKIASKIMEKMAGYGWVDEESKELLKAEVANFDSISIGWGIFGSVSLLRLDYERQYLPNGIWFVSRLKIRAKVRVFLFSKYNRLVDSTFYDVVLPR